MTNQLKPCPNPECQSTVVNIGNRYCFCNECGLETGTYEILEEALKVWNELPRQNDCDRCNNIPDELLECLPELDNDKYEYRYDESIQEDVEFWEFWDFGDICWKSISDSLNAFNDIVRCLKDSERKVGDMDSRARIITEGE